MSSILPPGPDRDRDAGLDPGGKPGKGVKSDADQDPSHLKWSKWASMATVAGVLVACIAILVQHLDDIADKKGNNVAAKDSSSRRTTDPSGTRPIDSSQKHSDSTEIVQPTGPTQNPESANVRKTILYPIAKPPIATTTHTANLWDSQLENRLHKILSDKTGKNVGKIAGSLVLSDPDKKTGNRLRYMLTLTIDFFAPASKKSCGQTMYRSIVETDATDTKDRILLQGLDGFDGIFVKVQQDNSLPPCVNP